jgi:hypothetical protein
MKRFIHLSIFLFCALLFAQNENYNGISYQGVARDAEGGILSNETISVIFRIVDNPQGEGQLYQETHTVTTDSYGLFNLSIGSVNQDQYSFEDIQWGEYEYCGLAVSIDFNNDGIYADMGIMKMEDVPTAKWAKNAEQANWATMAGEANNADFANYAFNAENAGNAEEANYAYNATGELLETITNLQLQIDEISSVWEGGGGFSGVTANTEAITILTNQISTLQEQVAALQNNNANASLMQTIETQSAQIAQLQTQVIDLYNVLNMIMPTINGMTIDQVIDYSGGDVGGFDFNNIIIDTGGADSAFD